MSWEANKNYIISQVNSGAATEPMRAWYERWVASGSPATQSGMMSKAEYETQQQASQGSQNPYGLTDGEYAQLQQYMQTGLVNPDGSINEDYVANMSLGERQDLFTGGFGLGDNDFHRQLREAFEQVGRPTPDNTGGGGLSFGAGDTGTGVQGNGGGFTNGDAGLTTGGPTPINPLTEAIGSGELRGERNSFMDAFNANQQPSSMARPNQPISDAWPDPDMGDDMVWFNPFVQSGGGQTGGHTPIGPSGPVAGGLAPMQQMPQLGGHTPIAPAQTPFLDSFQRINEQRAAPGPVTSMFKDIMPQ